VLEQAAALAQHLVAAVAAARSAAAREGFDHGGKKEGRPMLGKLVNRSTIAFGVGYLLGARAGRERYEQIMRWWDKVSNTPPVQRAAEQGKELVVHAKARAQELVSSRTGWTDGNGSAHTIREVMTTGVETVRPTDPISEAAAKMRQQDVGALVVVDDADGVCGIVTDRDITIRGVAEGLQPTTTIADVISRELTTLSPDDSIDRAVRLMRDRSIRRLPVVLEGTPVGIVSLGDLAIERDRSSALADISAAPSNR
jgi:CBS domain-containing protein